MDGIHKFEALVKRLEELKASFDLKHIRDGYFMIAVATPGKRWEVEVSVAGKVEVEVFKSEGKILEESDLDGLWKDLE